MRLGCVAKGGSVIHNNNFPMNFGRKETNMSKNSLPVNIGKQGGGSLRSLLAIVALLFLSPLTLAATDTVYSGEVFNYGQRTTVDIYGGQVVNFGTITNATVNGGWLHSENGAKVTNATLNSGMLTTIWSSSIRG